MKLVYITINIKLLTIIMLSLFVVACGGPVAYTNTSNNAAVATVITGTLSAASTSIPYNSSTTITWSSANTTPCTFSGDSSTGTAGTFTTPRLISNITYNLDCGSGSPPTLTIQVASSAVASAITAFAAGSVSGTVIVSSLNTLTNGTLITITGTTNYNGSFTVANATSTSFTISANYNGNDATGYWQLAGGMIYGCNTVQNPNNLSVLNLAYAPNSPSRFTGVAPLSIFLDASSTTSPVTSAPFHEIEYKWDFGDIDPISKTLNLSPPAPFVGGTSSWNMGSNVGGNSRNAATGPEATHIYETPGVYTVLLTAYDGTNMASNRCAQIVVQDPNTVFAGTNTICIGATSAPTQGQDGCPVGANTVMQSNFATAVNSYAKTGKRVLFKHDDTFTENVGAVIGTTGPGTIGMYGVGAKPKVQPATSAAIILGAPSTPTMQDWRIMDLEFDGQSNASVSGVGVNGDADQITLLRLNVHDMGSGIMLDADVIRGIAGTHIFDQFTVADGTFNTFRGEYGFYLFANRLALLGDYVNDTNGGTAQHVVRIMHSAKGVISNNTFGNPAPTKQTFTLRGVAYSTTNCPSGVCLPEYFPYGSYAALTSQTVISDNHFISGNTAQPVTVEPSDLNFVDTRFQDIILERNWYTSPPNTSCCIPMLKIDAQDVTVRNELIDMTNSAWHRGIAVQAAGTVSPTSNNVRIYNNTIFSNDSTSVLQPIQIQSGATNISFINNLAYSPNISGTLDTTNAAIASNNSTITNTNPYFVAASPTSPATFKITGSSYALGKGTAVPVWSDFFLYSMTGTAIRDMGAVHH
jgi:hypothetical protein